MIRSISKLKGNDAKMKESLGNSIKKYIKWCKKYIKWCKKCRKCDTIHG